MSYLFSSFMSLGLGTLRIMEGLLVFRVRTVSPQPGVHVSVVKRMIASGIVAGQLVASSDCKDQRFRVTRGLPQR